MRCVACRMARAQLQAALKLAAPVHAHSIAVIDLLLHPLGAPAVACVSWVQAQLSAAALFGLVVESGWHPYSQLVLTCETPQMSGPAEGGTVWQTGQPELVAQQMRCVTCWLTAASTLVCKACRHKIKP